MIVQRAGHFVYLVICLYDSFKNIFIFRNILKKNLFLKSYQNY